MESHGKLEVAAAAANDVFLLSDEQILDIAPETVVSHESPPVSRSGAGQASGQRSVPADMQTSEHARGSSLPATDTEEGPRGTSSYTDHGTQNTDHDSAEPPAWLAAEMKDPWVGDEARELWDGVVQARNEAAAYRAAIATPEDARALKELYPGGLNEARSAAERARTLDDFDRAFFGATGTPEQVSAARVHLARQLLQQDPGAFREMVQLGAALLQNAAEPRKNDPEPQAAPQIGSTATQPVAAVFRPREVQPDPNVSAAALPSFAQNAPPLPRQAGPPTRAGSKEGGHTAEHAAYAAFERAANEELERGVGATIAHTIKHALPNLSDAADSGAQQARHAVPLQSRLAAAVRQDVESALQSDRQLGEQIAQILSARSFDESTRAQVVRLIGERARQLVPGATRRVVSEWTQATLAAHRGRRERAEAASATAPTQKVIHGAEAARGSHIHSEASARSDRSRVRPNAIDYRKLSDEQILDL